MIVQWCAKGLALPNDDAARLIIDDKTGLVCNWWRRVGRITPAETRERLTARNLNFHVNHFTTIDPETGLEFRELTPFVSLSAGVIERDALAKTNHVHRARQTALWFGSAFGGVDFAYLFVCWLVLAPRQAVEIEGVAEEVRDLNTYRRYSPYQTEGEIVAKVIVPDNQIKQCERWDHDAAQQRFIKCWTQANQRFTQPQQLSNVRELI